MLVVLYWEDFVEVCISSLSSVDCLVGFISFLCASAGGDGMKRAFCKDLGGHAQAAGAEGNARLNLQYVMEVMSLGITSEQ